MSISTYEYAHTKNPMKLGNAQGCHRCAVIEFRRFSFMVHRRSSLDVQLMLSRSTVIARKLRQSSGHDLAVFVSAVLFKFCLLPRFTYRSSLLRLTATYHTVTSHSPNLIRGVDSVWKGRSGNSLVKYKFSLSANSRNCFGRIGRWIQGDGLQQLHLTSKTLSGITFKYARYVTSPAT